MFLKGLKLKKILSALLISACLSLSAVPAFASLVERDLLTANDALLTLDTTSGLEWLDVDVTVGRSYNDVSSELGAGGEFEGFRYATGAEMFALMEVAGLTVTDGAFVNTGEAVQMLNFIDLLGRTGFPSGGFPGPAVRGIYGDSFAPGTHAYASAGIRDSDMFTVVSIGESLGPVLFDDNATNAAIGSFLVREAAPVPLPPAFLLLLTAVAPLVGFSRRRTTA